MTNRERTYTRYDGQAEPSPDRAPVVPSPATTYPARAG